MVFNEPYIFDSIELGKNILYKKTHFNCRIMYNFDVENCSYLSRMIIFKFAIQIKNIRFTLFKNLTKR